MRMSGSREAPPVVTVDVKLPPYMVRVQRKSGVAFYFQVPARLRPKGWPGAQRLSDDLAAAIGQAQTLKERLDAERAGMLRRPQEGSLPWLLGQYHLSEKYRCLAPKTQRGYDQCAQRLLAWSERNGNKHVNSITRPSVLKFLMKFDGTPAFRNAIAVFLRLLLRHALDIGLITTNPAEKLGLRRPKRLTPFHPFTDSEIDAFVAAADATGHPGIGDALLIATEIGQREGDVLKMRRGAEYRLGEFVFTQSKTGRELIIPATERLMARFAARPATLYLVADAEGQPYKEDWFRHLFRRIADAAGLPKTARFMHARHSAVMRLSRLGHSVLAIATITGHSPKTADQIIGSHYWERDSAVARGVIESLNQARRKRPANGESDGSV